jgi:hypothetical protein
MTMEMCADAVSDLEMPHTFVTFCLTAGMNAKLGLLTVSVDLPGFPLSSEKTAIFEQEASLR